MSYRANSELAPALAKHRPLPCRAVFNVVAATVWIWRRRREERQELLDYLASDHRAAADIGVTGCEAQSWSRRPFWQG
jgi:uncharacterized protein YjiS (DUF1127 family)